MAMTVKSILWFRHGLRLHDNPSLLKALKICGDEKTVFYPVFIFDGESAGTQHVGYIRMKFLIDSLLDLDQQFKRHGGPGLFVFRGKPTTIFKRMHEEFGINKICYEQDCEPIWQRRDREVVQMCRELKIETVESISHTLWNPRDIIRANGGHAPLTYQMMLHTIDVLGPPNRPVELEADFSNVQFGNINDELGFELELMTNESLCPEEFSIDKESSVEPFIQHIGGETVALSQFALRLKIEEDAFTKGTYLPNQANVELLNPPTALSGALRFGCLSVRKFYYAIHDKFNEVQEKAIYKAPLGHHITGQLIWREYFYTMSVDNPNYAQMAGNPICLNIPWGMPDEEKITKWKEGRTGIPIIDAAMRQLLSEGFIHHFLRNIVATFLTRTGLWLSWEIGLDHFLKYLIDADWSVCAGNWMWVSSSAFEKLLDSSKCNIVPLAMRMDPDGEYIKRYVPELRRLPKKYIHQPWMTPIEIQREVMCIIGEDYELPIIDLVRDSKINCLRMKTIRESLIESQPHVRPSDEDEIRTVFWIKDEICIRCY